MSRTERLFDLIQLLRQYRYPVSAAVLADKLGIAVRSLYRDIATLRSQGAHIDGEAGVGYVLRPGFMLPPLMFSEEEIEALVLGSRWVAKRTDSKLKHAAASALAKIAAVLPVDLRNQLDTSSMLVAPIDLISAGDKELILIRQAIRRECKMNIQYRDLKDQESQRIIWPFALGFFEQVRIVVAWCELRQEFRHFRTDRIMALELSDERYPRRRQTLLKQWREQQGIPPQ